MISPRIMRCALALAIATTVLAALGPAWASEGDTFRDDRASSRVPATAHAKREHRPQPAFGVQFHGTWGSYSDQRRAQVLDRIRDSGARWVRLDVGWATLAPTPHGYDMRWAVPMVDRVIEQIRARGLKVLVTFWLTPAWANDGGSTRMAPRDPTAYAEALGWAVRRWGSKVRAWEVWNEPNSEDFLVGADPAAYTRLLCRAYEAAHDADPKAKVLFGGVMYNDDDWIRQAYQAGAKGCFDVMATHPYMGPSDIAPGTADRGDIWTLRHVQAVRELMKSRGDRKPIWATEFGWSTHRGGDQPWNRGVTPEQQADYAVDALRILRNDYPYVRKAFWYNEVEMQTGNEHLEGYALLRSDLSPRPVYSAVRDYLTERDG